MLESLMVLCALRNADTRMDGETAGATAKQILKSTGMGADALLQAVQYRRSSAFGKCWSIELTTERGNVLMMLDDQSGRARLIQIVKKSANPPSDNQTPTPQSVRRASVLLHSLGYDKEVTLQADTGYQSGPGMAQFYPMSHGLRFFNINPTYAHRLLFDPDGGALNYFLASPALPPVNAWKPEVKSDIAVKKISEWARAKARQKSLTFFKVPDDLKAELGYWKFQKDEAARLVWRVNQYRDVNGAPYASGSYRVFVDALTGKLIEPDDPGMGDNP